MNFKIERKDQKNFRNFEVKIGKKILIDRNDDFYAELTEWVDGLLSLMKNGQSYFSTSSGFTPFYGVLSDGKVEFERVDGTRFAADFYEVVSGTITFLFEQAGDDSSFQRDADFFEKKANMLLAGFRFRFKENFKPFIEHLKGRGIITGSL